MINGLKCKNLKLFWIQYEFLIIIYYKSGVHGHMNGELPWATCEEPLRPSMARLVGS